MIDHDVAVYGSALRHAAAVAAAEEEEAYQRYEEYGEPHAYVDALSQTSTVGRAFRSYTALGL